LKKDYRYIFRIAATYIGAIIGAGFASGQEIFRFFTVHGFWGYLGIITCGLLLASLGYITFKISINSNLNNYSQLFYQLGGRRLGSLADSVILLFLLGSFVVMLSGSGEIFNNYFRVDKNLGILLTIIIVISAIKFGIEGVMNLNLFLIPVLILIVFITFWFNVESNLSFNLQGQGYNNIVFNNWLLYSIIYVIYNYFLALPVLIAIPTQINDLNLLKKGSILAGGLLVVLALVINILLVQNLSLITESQIPILEILNYHNKGLHILYSVVLWSAMITTATSSLYGLVIRSKERFSLQENKMLTFLVIFSFLLSKFRFDSLVAVVYPFLGYIGGLILIFLFLNYLKSKIIL